MEKPFVSFCMTSYNQRDYALVALEAAFRQDYPNMEILVSDDASTDGSVEAFRQLLDRHSHLKDRVTILTSDRNVGCTVNYEKLIREAKGELIIAADGDDISEPNRVSRIVEEWVKMGKTAAVVFSDGWKIDGNGNVIGVIGSRSIECPLGACMAFSPRVVLDFPTVTYTSAYQDHVFGRRGTLIGGVLHLQDRLVRYRIGSGVSSVLFNRRQPELRSARAREAAFRQSIVDIVHWHSKGNIDNESYLRLRVQYGRLADRNKTFADLLEGRSFGLRWAAYRKLYSGFSLEGLLRIPYLFPRTIGDLMYGTYGVLRFAFRRIAYWRKGPIGKIEVVK